MSNDKAIYGTNFEIVKRIFKLKQITPRIPAG